MAASLFTPLPPHPVSSNHVNPRRHPRFYFSDGNVIFEVEGGLYKVHRYFFERDSPVFSDMFSLPCPTGYIPEGLVDENPIALEGIEAKDFNRLLCLFYPQSFKSCEIQDAEGWISVLSLATRWDFTSLRDLAISKLNPTHTIMDLIALEAVDKIVLGHRFEVAEWLLPAYNELCLRKEPLSHEEGEKLGVHNVINIAHVRQAIRYPSNINRSVEGVFSLVKEVCIQRA